MSANLCHHVFGGFQRQVHGVPLPNEKCGKIKIKIVLAEQVDQSICHVVASNEPHISGHFVALIAALFQLQRRAIIKFEVSDANHGFSYSPRIESCPQDDDLTKT